MKTAKFWALASIIFLLPQIVGAQDAAGIERLINNSKLVEPSHPVRAVLSGNQVAISTYCHPSATDKDCKINALFMMKELMRHYKTVYSARVTFFDELNVHLRRTVKVTVGDASLVDSGRPISEVLALIEISNNAASVARLTRQVQSNEQKAPSAKQSTSAPVNCPANLTGGWESDMGPLIVTQSNNRISGVITSTGDSFSGTYDATAGILKLSFFDSIKQMHGEASFAWSSASQEFKGVYKIGGQSLRWWMHRS